MAATVPVAGAIDPASAGADLLVVEAHPESDATRACKGIARHVYRFAQEVRWSGSERAVSVRIVGGEDDAALVGANLALLLSPLLDVGLEASGAITRAFDTSPGDDHPSPRDRLWLVPTDALAEAAERYEMTIGSVGAQGIVGADLVLILADPGVGPIRLPEADALTDYAVVFVGATDGDLPDEVAVA